MRREVYIEAGHRCAVCGTAMPLEKAHIVPWSETNDHSLENLLCLCANCHGRADSEKWGAQTLREYKKRPWVNRRDTVNATPDQDKELVEVTVPIDLSKFDERARRMLVMSIAGLLGVHPDEIRIERVQ